jgi:hypothetical protein
MRVGRRFFVAVVLGVLLCAAATTSTAGGSSSACPAGTKRAVIGGKVKCLKAGQRCQARYQAAYKRAGFTCVSGRLRKRTPPPAPPPPVEPPPVTPPPAPPAQPGHYHGTTSQLETIDMDVTSDGRTVTNIHTGQINQGCTPPGHLFGGGISMATRTLGSDGSFVVDFPASGSFSDGTQYTAHYNLTGRFSGSTATGTLTVTTNFTANGTAYSCGSGQQTWTATRTG